MKHQLCAVLFACSFLSSPIVAAEGSDDPVVRQETEAPCNDRLSGDFTEHEASFDLDSVTDTLCEKIGRVPYIETVSARMGAQFGYKKTETCCDPEAMVDPTELLQYSGGGSIGFEIAIQTGGYHFMFKNASKPNAPLTWSVEGKLILGPVISPSGSLTVGLEGEAGECVDCKTISGSGSVTMEGEFKGEAKLEGSLFEKDKWYNLSFDLSAGFSIGVSSGITISGIKYTSGEICEGKTGLEILKVDWNGVTGTASIQASALGYTFNVGKEVVLFSPKSLL